MDSEQRKKAERILYALEKEAARSSLVEFFEEWGLSIEDWDDFKVVLMDTYNLDGSKFYIKP